MILIKFFCHRARYLGKKRGLLPLLAAVARIEYIFYLWGLASLLLIWVELRWILVLIGTRFCVILGALDVDAQVRPEDLDRSVERHQQYARPVQQSFLALYVQGDRIHRRHSLSGKMKIFVKFMFIPSRYKIHRIYRCAVTHRWQV